MYYEIHDNINVLPKACGTSLIPEACGTSLIPEALVPVSLLRH